MESLDNTGGAAGFVKHVFKFDDASKADMLNIVSTLCSFIPVIIVNKAWLLMFHKQTIIKEMLKLLGSFLQVSLMFLGFLLPNC